MASNIGNSSGRTMLYSSPQVKVIPVKTQGMLCQSPENGPMREHDFGDGGFTEA